MTQQPARAYIFWWILWQVLRPADLPQQRQDQISERDTRRQVREKRPRSERLHSKIR